MKLLLYLNVNIDYDGTYYFSDGKFVNFYIAIEQYFDKVTICAPLRHSERNHKRYKLRFDKNKTRFVGLPFYSSPFELYLTFPLYLFRAWKLLRAEIPECNIVGAAVPNLIGVFLILLSKRKKKNSFLLIREDIRKELFSMYENIIAKYCLGVVGFLLEKMLFYLARNSLAITVGKVYHGVLKKGKDNLHDIVVSYISQASINNQTYISPDGNLRILYVGNLRGEKGTKYLIQAVASLTKFNKDIKLELLGDGPEKDKLTGMIDDMGLGRHINMHGHITDESRLNSFYRSADMIVLPSLSEGLPKVILEAMANGIPIIATRVGGIPTFIKDGIDGLLIPPADTDAIVNAIQRLASDVELRKRLATNALSKAKQYSKESQLHRMATIIKRYCMSFQE